MGAYVYLIEEVPHRGEKTGPWTKIGYSKNPPEWRLNANLTRGNPRNLRIAYKFEFNSEQAARTAEKKAHQEFRAYLHQKEWFRIPPKKVRDWFQQSGQKAMKA